MNRPTLDALSELDGEGPARPLDDDQAEALIAGALDAWAPPRASASGAGQSAAWWATAAAVMLIAGAAAAALVLRGPNTVRPETEAESAPPAESGTETPTDRGAAAAPQRAREEDRFPEPVEIAHEDDSVLDVAPRPRRRPRATPERTPDDLLQRANQLRGGRRWAEAERTYLEVTSAYPGTHAAYVAQVAAASIRLERLGRAAAAARLFRAAIRTGGPLDPEARDGLARALRRSGDRSGERQALQGLLERHPGSPYASRARERLAELEAAGPR